MKLKIGVLFGGQSVEHEVSIISASQAMAALDTSLYDVIPIYLTKDSELYSSEALTKIESFKDLKALKTNTPQVTLAKIKQKYFLLPVKAKLFSKPQELDLVIPVVHGTHSEDGTVQGYLETMGIPYSGSDVMASAIGQDKVFMKLAFEKAGLPVVPWFSFNDDRYRKDSKAILSQTKKLGYPVVIKPANLGSSVGISLVHDEVSLKEAIDLAFSFDSKVLIEKAVLNLREVNCSLLGDGEEVKASVLEEVFKKDAILSYKDKYQGSAKTKTKGMASTSRLCPAPLNADLTHTVQDLAIQCFKSLGCQGVARMDFLMDAKTGTLYVNEINTIPGSLSFYLWEASGLSFPKLMDALVQQAIHRHRQREKRIHSLDTNLLESYRPSSKGTKSSL